MAHQIRGLPVITVPVKLKEQIAIAQKRKKAVERQNALKTSRQGDLSKPVITCKRSEFNFYKGQTYDKFSAVSLASQGWHNRQSRGDFFKIHPYGMIPGFMVCEDISNDFESLELDNGITEQFKKLGFEQPTNIQSLAIPHILRGSNTVVAAETGNGKTFTFIAPIIHKILELKRMEGERTPKLNAPRALVIVPGRELVIQTRDMARSIGTDLGINITSFVGGRTKRLMTNPRVVPTDLLIASFGALSKLTTLGIYNMNMVRHIVLDEADTLLDDSFNEKMKFYLSKFPIKVTKDEDTVVGASTGVQLILVGATFPRSMNTILNEVVELDSLVEVKTPLLHRVSPHIEQIFYRVGHDDRAERLLRLVKGLHKANTPSIIFSNCAKSCNFVNMILKSHNIPCLQLHGEMKASERATKFRGFQNDESNILSCTDLTSRGLNTVRVEHIINFDFPRFISDYIHRCGRTGRVGGTSRHCQVTNFAFRSYEIDLVQKIEYAVRKSEALPNVNANIKRIIRGRREKYEQKLMSEDNVETSED